MSLYFDNEKLFDTEGHLTKEGLYALKGGTLDDLGALEAAEHLSFCDYCLLRYTALIDAAPACLQEPMRDLIPQVQNLMRLRRFRIMTNRYVSAAAAVVLCFMLWGFVSMGGSQRAARVRTAGGQRADTVRALKREHQPAAERGVVLNDQNLLHRVSPRFPL